MPLLALGGQHRIGSGKKTSNQSPGRRRPIPQHAKTTRLGLDVVAAQLFQVVSPRVRDGARLMYGFFSTAVTYPLTFAISVAMTPWGEIVTAFHWVNIVTALSTGLTLVVRGFIVGRMGGMYPVEAAIVNATHGGLGGTGDVAILTAAGRMELMPFAQIATRIGGAVTVMVALAVLAWIR